MRGLNESPELIAQEYAIHGRLRQPANGLNESPELIAQEYVDSGWNILARCASMKVLSLLLRNSSGRHLSGRSFRPQ